MDLSCCNENHCHVCLGEESEQLASGSFGVVFLAKDKKTNQQAPWPSEHDSERLRYGDGMAVQPAMPKL